MKPFKNLGPVTEERKQELERQLEVQKQRFMAASRRGIGAVKKDLSVLSWMRQYPIESAVLLAVGGYAVARIVQARRSATRYRGAQEVA